MKRFALFVGAVYGRKGGWYDFRAAFDTTDEARADAIGAHQASLPDEHLWWHIVDVTTGTIVLDDDGYDMPPAIDAPFPPDVVAAAKAWQAEQHPYTCPKGHTLDVFRAALVCFPCNYRQTWVHDHREQP